MFSANIYFCIIININNSRQNVCTHKKNIFMCSKTKNERKYGKISVKMALECSVWNYVRKTMIKNAWRKSINLANKWSNIGHIIMTHFIYLFTCQAKMVTTKINIHILLKKKAFILRPKFTITQKFHSVALWNKMKQNFNLIYV